MRGLNLLSTQCDFLGALSPGVWAVVLRACFSLVSNTAYQNQELLVSGAVSTSSTTNESVG